MTHTPTHTLEQTEEQRLRAFSDASILEAGGVIDSQALTPIQSFNVTPVPEVIISDIASIPTEDIKIEEVKEEPKTDFIAQLEALTSGTGIDAQAEIEKAEAPFQKQLIEINKQIRLQQAEALEAKEVALERGETLGFASLEAQKVQKQATFEALRLSAIAEALQGNITLAGNQAERAVNLEFAEQEQKIKTARKNIIDNFEEMTKAQQKRALRTLEDLDRQDAFVKDEKAESKELRDLEIKVAATGKASNAQLDELGKFDDIVEANVFASQFLKKAVTPIGEKTAKDFFTNTQIARGAANAGMTFSEFSKLSVDEANKFINVIEFEFSDDDLGKLIDAGFSDEEITDFETREIPLEDALNETPGDKEPGLFDRFLGLFKGNK